MTISLIKAFRGLYRLCQCGCGSLVKIIRKNGLFTRYIAGHHDRKSKKPRKPKKYRTTNGGYNVIYKPYYPYSHPKSGYAKEHRYIMYLYLSILNNKVTYLSENDDVHHINGNKKDNRIENLELIKHGNHSKITYKDNNGLKEYKTIKEELQLKKYCNLCKSKTTRRILFKSKNEKYYYTYDWRSDINGNLCYYCYNIIYKFRMKFGLSTSGY